MSTTEGQITGSLRNDAPGVHAALGRLCGGIPAPSLELAYRLSCERGGLNEGPIRRHEGASFNPRSARICHILMHECRETRLDPLGAALLISSSPPAALPSELQAAGEMTNRARAFLAGGACNDSAAERVALAFQLDLLRHAHMTESALADVEQLVSRTKGIVARVASSDNERLRIMIQAWLDRNSGASGSKS